MYNTHDHVIEVGNGIIIYIQEKLLTFLAHNKKH